MLFDLQLELIYSDKASNDLGTDYWIVNKQFKCTLDSTKNQTVTIHKGFLTDGASVPRILWNVFPRWGKYGQAACVHDFLCEYLIISDNGKIRDITRSECDMFFLKLMEEMNIPKKKRLLMYWGVSLFRIFAVVKKPSITARKAELECLLTDRYDKTGVWL